MNTNKVKNFYSLFKSYIEQYGHLYSAAALEHINDNFATGLDNDMRADVLNQVYAHLGMLTDEQNLYKGYLKLLKYNFNIDNNILEVGGGYLPVMAEYIDCEQQQIGTGTITVYDPNLVVNKLGNINLVKKEFKPNYNISEYDLVMGIMPCEATEMIIKAANNANKDFFIGLCGCTHFDHNYYEHISSQQWFNYIYRRANENLNEDRQIDIKLIDQSYGLPYPVIISKSKQYKRR
jgi:hypothetical protein